MTQGRYDSRRGEMDPRDRMDRHGRSGRDERSFMDRARDEVSSWFGDDDAERRRDRDMRFDERRFEDDRYAVEGRARDSSGYERFDRDPRYREESYRRPYTGRFSGSSGGFGGVSSQPDRNPRQFEITGRHDPDYSQWRSRQIDELDRDYDEFRRENQSRFDREFSAWRTKRQAKREMLGAVTDHMDVVGSDGQPIGKVDWVKGDRLVLAKADSPDGRHHAISCSMVDRVEDGKVFLDRTAEEMQREFTRSDRNRALFEPERDEDDGPHMLNRSFSGTY